MKLISRLRILLLALALVPMLAFATAPGAVSAQSTTRNLRLVSLQCIETEDLTGDDEPYLRVAGIEVWKSKGMNNGHTADLTSIPAKSFTGQVNVSLYDEDSGVWEDDDHLGTVTVMATEAGQGNHTAYFTEDGASYRLTYYVY